MRGSINWQLYTTFTSLVCQLVLLLHGYLATQIQNQKRISFSYASNCSCFVNICMERRKRVGDSKNNGDIKCLGGFVQQLCSEFLNYKVLIQSMQGESVRTVLERFYLTRETVNNNQCKLAINKQKKTIELVHNSVQYSTTYFSG